MVVLLGIAASFVNLKIGGLNPLLGSTSITDVFSLRPAVACFFPRLFITKRWLALTAEPKNSECQNVLIFDVFRRALKIPGKNPALDLH